MAGTVPQGTVNRVWVGASGPPTTLVDYLQQFEFGNQSDTTQEEFYNGDAPIVTVGVAKYDGTGSGKWADSAPGLSMIVAGARLGTLLYFGVAPNGAAGTYAPGRFSRFRITGGGPRQAAGYTFSFAQDGAVANIGAGLE